MPFIHFEKRKITSTIRNPLKEFQLTEEEIEVRTDPLLGYNTRILDSKGLDVVPEHDPLPDFVQRSESCFFCEGRVETQTPMMPEAIHAGGRFAVGEALLFPNLAGYGKYSGVCIFSKEHFISLENFREQQVFDALKACQMYFRICAKADDEKLYPTVNWNYLLPAGSSLLHPHLQPILDPASTNFHRDLLDGTDLYSEMTGSNFWVDLMNVERDGPRYLFETENAYWFTPFAPIGFNEINGIVGKGEPYTDSSDEALRDLASGIIRLLQFYHSERHNSFNLTLFSSPVFSQRMGEKIPCVIKAATRPVFTSHYRNDVTFFERFHQESVIDRSPEDVAGAFKKFLKC